MRLVHELFPTAFIPGATGELRGAEERRHRHLGLTRAAGQLGELQVLLQIVGVEFDDAGQAIEHLRVQAGFAVMSQRLAIRLQRLGVLLAFFQQARQLHQGHDILRR